MLRLVTRPRSHLRFGVLAKSLRHYHPTPTPLAHAVHTQGSPLPLHRHGSSIKWSTYLKSLWMFGPLLALLISKGVLANASEEHDLLLALVRLQRLDADYDSYDLNKDEDLLNYLDKVISCLVMNPPSQEIAKMAKIIKDHDAQSNYTLLRNYLVEVHNTIGQNRLVEPVETSRKVFSALARLVGELEGERAGPGGSK